MSHTIAGNCGKCGAPYYVPSVWMAVIPPPPTPTCACWNLPVSTTTNRVVLNQSVAETEAAK